MSSTFKALYVIPCYNEAKKFEVDTYLQFLNQFSDIFICFVNDGSQDQTQSILESVKSKFPNQVEVLLLEKNVGKAEAVRQGVLFSLSHVQSEFIGFLDADLAVSLEEGYDILSYLKPPYEFVFGSRILRIGSTIDRKRYRFIIGRVIATMISEILDIKVYDTQCGCKFFKTETASELFEQPFISKWLFDVELFFRMLKLHGKESALQKMYEVPLSSWIEKGDSKVEFSYMFKIGIDLYRIRNKYK